MSPMHPKMTSTPAAPRRWPGWRLFVLVGACLGWSVQTWAAGPALDARTGAAARSEAAAGWLRLERDQRAIIRQGQPTTPAETDRRVLQRQQEALELRGLLQRQQGEIGAASRPKPPAKAPTGQGARALGARGTRSQEFDALRLRQQQRRALKLP